MSKYEQLWAWIGAQEGKCLTLTFAQVGEVGGTPLDHSFLTFKKELAAYGWRVGKISMKQQTVVFERLGEQEKA